MRQGAEEICGQLLHGGQSLIGVEHYRIVVPKGDQRGHHVDDGGDDKVCKIVIGPGILALNEIIERLKDNIISQKHSNEHYIAGYRPA